MKITEYAEYELAGKLYQIAASKPAKDIYEESIDIVKIIKPYIKIEKLTFLYLAFEILIERIKKIEKDVEIVGDTATEHQKNIENVEMIKRMFEKKRRFSWNF